MNQIRCSLDTNQWLKSDQWLGWIAWKIKGKIIWNILTGLILPTKFWKVQPKESYNVLSEELICTSCSMRY